MEVELEGSQLYDNSTYNALSEYWRKEQLLKNLGYEKEKPSDCYDAIDDPNIESHMKWHLRERTSSNNKYSVLIATDFTFPKFGGVETHGYQLA